MHALLCFLRSVLNSIMVALLLRCLDDVGANSVARAMALAIYWRLTHIGPGVLPAALRTAAGEADAAPRAAAATVYETLDAASSEDDWWEAMLKAAAIATLARKIEDAAVRYRCSIVAWLHGRYSARLVAQGGLANTEAAGSPPRTALDVSDVSARFKQLDILKRYGLAQFAVLGVLINGRYGPRAALPEQAIATTSAEVVVAAGPESDELPPPPSAKRPRLDSADSLASVELLQPREEENGSCDNETSPQSSSSTAGLPGPPCVPSLSRYPSTCSATSNGEGGGCGEGEGLPLQTGVNKMRDDDTEALSNVPAILPAAGTEGCAHCAWLLLAAAAGNAGSGSCVSATTTTNDGAALPQHLLSATISWRRPLAERNAVAGASSNNSGSSSSSSSSSNGSLSRPLPYAPADLLPCPPRGLALPTSPLLFQILYGIATDAGPAAMSLYPPAYRCLLLALESAASASSLLHAGPAVCAAAALVAAGEATTTRISLRLLDGGSGSGAAVAGGDTLASIAAALRRMAADARMAAAHAALQASAANSTSPQQQHLPPATAAQYLLASDLLSFIGGSMSDAAAAAVVLAGETAVTQWLHSRYTGAVEEVLFVAQALAPAAAASV